MAIIYSYPLTTPKVKDLLIGTSVFDEDDENSPRNNPTVSFTIESLLDMIGTGGSQTLQQVTNLGATTTNAITIANGLSVNGTFTDSAGLVGTAGQVLSSTGIGTSWASDSAATLKQVLAAGNDSGGDHDINMTGDISNITLPPTSYSGSPNKGRIILGDYPNTYTSFFSLNAPSTAPNVMYMKGTGRIIVEEGEVDSSGNNIGGSFSVNLLPGAGWPRPVFQVASAQFYVLGNGPGVPTVDIQSDRGNIIFGRYRVYTGSNDFAMTNSTQLVMSTSIPDWAVGQAIGMTVTGTGISTITKIVSKVYGTSPLVTFTLSSPITIAANTTLTFKWTGNDTLAYNLAVDTIGNVVQTPIGGLSVTSVNSSQLFAYKGILVTPTSGAVVVGLNINDLPSLPAAIADEDVMVIVDDPSGTGAGVKNHKTTVGDLKTHINTNTTYDYFAAVTGTLYTFAGGTGYNDGTFTNVATTGGTGTGLTVTYTFVTGIGINVGSIDNSGTGYTVGDVCEIPTVIAGTTASITITSIAGNVNPNLRLIDSNSVIDDIKLTGSGGTTITRTSNTGITISSTEADTLQTVTARGASSSIATNFTGGLTVNGAGAGAYFYVGGNAQATAPPLTYDTGMAMVWNNSGGSRENEIYYATGGMSTVPAADRQGVNDNSYFAFINRFNPLGTPTDTTTMKLYGSGLLELTGPTATATIRNSHWRMPVTGAPNTGYILAKSSGSINLEWIQANTYNSNISGVPGTATSAGSAGSIRFDANYIYVCYATDSWRRAALATW